MEDLVQLNIFLSDVRSVDGAKIGEFYRRNTGKNSKTVRLLRYNSQVCYAFDVNTLFKAHRCPSCDTSFNTALTLESHLPKCIERVNHVYPETMSQLREPLFDKPGLFDIPYRDNKIFFNNMAIFDFESSCAEDENFKDTKTTTRIGRHTQASVSMSSNLIPEAVFLCNLNPRDLISSFVDALENLATRSKAQTKMNFLQTEATMNETCTFLRNAKSASQSLRRF